MNPTTPTSQPLTLEVYLEVSETIRELKKVPSGHLYAMVMGKMSLEVYQAIITRLKAVSLVRETAHQLTWIGPTFETKENSQC